MGNTVQKTKKQLRVEIISLKKLIDMTLATELCCVKKYIISKKKRMKKNIIEDSSV